MGAVSPKNGQNIHKVKVEAQRQTVNALAHRSMHADARFTWDPSACKCGNEDHVGRAMIGTMINRSELHPGSSTARLSAPDRAAA